MLKRSKKPAAGKVMEAVLGGEGEVARRAIASISPEMARLFVEIPFGKFYARPALDLKTRELLAVAMLAAMGTARPQLKMHVKGALHVGCSRERIVEALMMVAVFAGFPASLNGLDAAREAMDEYAGHQPKEKNG